MVVSLAVDVLAILAGFLGMTWLLLLGLRDGTSEPAGHLADVALGDVPQLTLSTGDQGAFILMPDHVTTHAEMVAWMTQELPKLTAGITAKPHGG
mgnify:CR=1 FL=1